MIRLRHKLTKGDFMLDVDIEVPDVGITGVFGESGSGKTSLLRCIAGLEREQGLPVHKRNVGYVFQDPGLFPHLSVRGNIEYGAAACHDTPGRWQARCRHARNWRPA